MREGLSALQVALSEDETLLLKGGSTGWMYAGRRTGCICGLWITRQAAHLWI